ncbi:MAG: hypothetical protein AAFZ38_10600 [Myxococcota bacterium]
MIDRELMQSLGWSEELIQAAKKVASQTERSAVSTDSIHVNPPTTAESTRLELNVDNSRPLAVE